MLCTDMFPDQAGAAVATKAALAKMRSLEELWFPLCEPKRTWFNKDPYCRRNTRNFLAHPTVTIVCVPYVGTDFEAHRSAKASARNLFALIQRCVRQSGTLADSRSKIDAGDNRKGVIAEV